MTIFEFMRKAFTAALREGRTPRRWQMNMAAHTALLADYPQMPNTDHLGRIKYFLGVPVSYGIAHDGDDNRPLVELIVDELPSSRIEVPHG